MKGITEREIALKSELETVKNSGLSTTSELAALTKTVKSLEKEKEELQSLSGNKSKEWKITFKSIMIFQKN